MKKQSAAKPAKAAADQKAQDPVSSSVGRKRDHSLDARILEAALDILAEAGFDSMTMDMVSARAGTGKTTVYRRWPSKAELVRDALIWMSKGAVDLEILPDTGSLRTDLLALMKPSTLEYSARKLQVLAKLGSYFSAHPEAAEAALAGIFDPWTAINRQLMQRAIKRGELPAHADIETACQVIIAMTSHRSLTQHKSFGTFDYAKLLDTILLPALKSPKPPIA